MIRKSINELLFSEYKRTAGTDAGESWWSELPKLYKNNPTNNLTAEVANQGVLHFTQVSKF